MCIRDSSCAKHSTVAIFTPATNEPNSVHVGFTLDIKVDLADIKMNVDVSYSWLTVSEETLLNNYILSNWSYPYTLWYNNFLGFTVTGYMSHAQMSCMIVHSQIEIRVHMNGA